MDILKAFDSFFLWNTADKEVYVYVNFPAKQSKQSVLNRPLRANAERPEEKVATNDQIVNQRDRIYFLIYSHEKLTLKSLTLDELMI